MAMEYSRRSFVAALGCALVAAPVVLSATGCSSNDTSSQTSSSASSQSTKSSASASSESDAEFKLVEAGKLTIGSDLAYPPMEYMDGDTPTGFGVAMMEEICDRIGLECNFLSPQNFDTLITQVAAGTTMDVAMSSITITDEREEEVDFSDPYYDSNQAIVVLKDSGITSRDELNGQPVAAQSGTTGEDWIRENLKDSEFTAYNTPAEALAALRTGAVVAVVYDEPVAQNNVSGEYDDCEILDVIATGEQYGIAINKDNDALREAINAALADMEDDGTMDELKETWIGSGSSSSASGDEKSSQEESSASDANDAASSKADASSGKADAASSSKD
jgi:ABC-type amino acid transport substrate-binding protein